MRLRFTTLLLVVCAVGLLLDAGCRNPREGYAPTQPIPFSHYLHAGQHEIECQYCHVSPAAGRHSTVPSVEICMNCHSAILGRSEEGQAALTTLRTAYENDEPIEWVKVHDLPDFVYYDHKPHIAHGLDCNACHGEVKEHEVIATRNEFNMGWCVNCHRQPEHNAPLNCTTCHR